MKDSKIIKEVINNGGKQNRLIKSDYPFFKNGLLFDLIFNHQVPSVQDTEELINERGEFSFSAYWAKIKEELDINAWY